MPERQSPQTTARATGRTSFATSELEQSKQPPNKERTAFSAAELKTEPPLRDQDNVQMRPKPRGISLDHPRLAPPGMSGIKANDRAGGLAAPDKREFKPLASPSKDFDRER